MRALHWDGTRLAVVDRPNPPPSDTHAIVRVLRAGVCNTDLEIVRGYMGFQGVLGHEFVGEVTSGPPSWMSRRVVGEINFSCGSCSFCKDGLSSHCPSRSVMGILNADGAIAENLAVPLENLHIVPDAVTNDAAVFVEPLAAAFEILEQVRVRPRQSCTVLGDGKLGLLVALVLARAGANVLLVGKHPEKLDIAAQQGVTTALLHAWSRDPSEIVVEATGTAGGLELAIGSIRPRGTLVLKSTVSEPSSVHLAPLVIHEITVVGSRCGPFPKAIHALATRTVDVLPLIGARVPLSDAAYALVLAKKPGMLKVLVDCASSPAP